MSLPITDMHLHLTAHRSDRARPEMTAAPVFSHVRELGFHAVGFVEHLNHSGAHPRQCMEELVRDVRSLPPTHGIDVRIGAELDINGDQGLFDCVDELAGLGLDFTIASVHGHLLRHLPPSPPLEAVISLETAWMLAAVKGKMPFDLLGHPWAISRQQPGWNFAAVPASCRDGLVSALQASGRACNLTHRALADVGNPDFEGFIRTLLEAGVRIGVGSDAHALDAVEKAVSLTLWLETLGARPENLWWPTPLLQP